MTQGGVPFMQADELINSYQLRKKIFVDATCYLGVIPTYVGGFMAFGWSTDNPLLKDVSLEEIKKRMNHFEGDTKYYTPELHKASFVLPKFIQNHLKEVDQK